jgi:hypothetical protein
MMLPLIDRLHELVPSARVDIVAASPRVVDLLKSISKYSRCVLLGFRLWARSCVDKFEKLLRMMRFVRTELFGREYDLCLLLRWGDPEMSVFLAAMTSAARVGSHDPGKIQSSSIPLQKRQIFWTTCVAVDTDYQAVRELRLL